MSNLKQTTTLVLLVLLIFILVFFQSSLFQFFVKTKKDIQNLFRDDFSYEELQKLRAENERLRFELKKIRQEGNSSLENDYLRSKVFSKYPFNDKKTIILSSGSNDGLKEGMPVLSPAKYLIGKVTETTDRTAKVKTIFDRSWKSSVGIKNSRIEAVLKGGDPPRLSLVPENDEIKKGVKVFNISPDYPLNQVIGKVKSISDSQEGVLNKGQVSVPYSFRNLNEVFVVTNFP